MSCECLPGGIVVECLDDGVAFVKVLDNDATACRGSIDGDNTDNDLADCDMASNDLYGVVAVARGMDDVGIMVGEGFDGLATVVTRV